jgi:hypothetical protein
MLVLVASTGAAVSVACDAASSVGAVGDALASHPDVAVPRRDQLLIFQGRRLEGETRTLGEYGLPERAGDAEAAQDEEEPRFKRDAEYVFLYRKSALVSDKSEKRSSSSSSRAFEEPSRDGDRSSRDDPVHTTCGAISIEIAPTPPPPRSDGSHPLERAAVAFFVDSSKKTGPVTNDQKGSESDITVDVSETSSRLHRLVALERSLEHAAARVEATNAASTKRVNAAATLTRATRVRALAADAASASAETHLAAALAAHAEFMRRANERVRFQTDLLSTFEDDLETLQTTTLFFPSLEKTLPDDERKQKKTTRETKTLLDLVDVSRLREKRDAAKNAHDSFVAKLHALDSRVARLKQETELLFMTLPEVDVEALEAELESARDALRAQNAIVEEVRADAATARAIAARCVAALAESSVSTEDSAETNDSKDSKDSKDSAETMADGRSASTRLKTNQLLSAEEIDALSNADASHFSSSFARVAATDDVLAAFHAHCATCASAMDANARALLVKIAETQNEIAKLRDARFAFEEIADRTEKPFCFLFGACRALPKRHAACLAEKARRVAYADRLAARARRAADLFAADREEERERRDAFRKTLVKTEERFFGKGRTEKSAFSQALDAVTNATLGSVSSAPSVEITVRGVSRAEAGSAPTRPEPETNEETKKDDVDEALAAVFAESL